MAAAAAAAAAAALCSALLTGAGATAAGAQAAAAARAAASGGTWGKAEEVPGTAALNKGGIAQVDSVSCRSAGNCSAGGSYTDGSRHYQAFVVGETNGTWGTAEELPGTAALNKGTLNQAGRAGINSVWCASAGHCGAGGEYVDINYGQQAFVDSET